MIDRRYDANYNTMAFPSKLYAMLEDADGQDFHDVISWQADGKSFKVRKPECFATTIMRAYFAQSKYKSFQRQLNIYGWKKIQLGPNKGGYMHKDFVRGSPHLCDRIVRRKEVSSSTIIPQMSNDYTSPLAGTAMMPFMSPLMPSPMMSPAPGNSLQPCSAKIQLNEAEVNTFYDFFYSSKDIRNKGAETSSTRMSSSLPLLPPSASNLTLSSLFELDAGDEITSSSSSNTSITNPLYRGLIPPTVEEAAPFGMDDSELNDFIGLLTSSEDCMYPMEESPLQVRTSEDIQELTPRPVGESTYLKLMMLDFHDVLYSTTNINATKSEGMPTSPEDDVTGESYDLSFPYKLHLMLENAERDNYAHAVSWIKNGTAFKVHDCQAFVENVMPHFFDQSKYESFRRQLNLYQFKRVARGPDRSVISHPSFVKGHRDQCRDILRKKHQEEGRPMVLQMFR